MKKRIIAAILSAVMILNNIMPIAYAEGNVTPVPTGSTAEFTIQPSAEPTVVPSAEPTVVPSAETTDIPVEEIGISSAAAEPPPPPMEPRDVHFPEVNLVKARMMSASTGRNALPPTASSAGIFQRKSLIKDGEDYALQLEVWTEGKVSVVPTEIVFIVDQSASMRQVVNSNKAYNVNSNNQGYMTVKQFYKNYPDGSKIVGADSPGYFMAVGPRVTNVTYGTDINTNGTDWNGYVSSHYRAAMIRWNNTTNQWEISKGVSTTEQTALNINPMYKDISTMADIESMTWMPLDTHQWANNANVKVFKSVYGSTVESYHTLLDTVQDIPNTKIAVVGFSSPRSMGHLWDNSLRVYRGGTGAFIVNDTGTVEYKHALGLTETDYTNALISTATQEGKDDVRNAIRSLFSNYSQTSTDEGFLITNAIFEASNKANGYDKNSKINRVVVLFTDGCPTIKSTSTEYNRAEGREAAVRAAYITKNEYNAKVYTYGPEIMITSNSSDFEKASELMPYLSSEYPQAQSMSNPGPKAEGTYTGFAKDSADLKTMFENLATSIFEESEALNEGASVVDVITPYFHIGGNYNKVEGEETLIKVYEVPYTGKDSEGNHLFEGTPVQLETTTPDDPDPGTKVIVTKDKVKYESNESGEENYQGLELDTVVVTNYDYTKASVNPVQIAGNQLRIVIPIEVEEEYIGGNYTLTNAKQSGVYTETGEEVNRFPQPDTDVIVKDINQLDVEVRARSGITYLDTLELEQLKPYVDVQILIENKADPTQNRTLTLDLTKENFGLAPWKVDHVNVKYIFEYQDPDGNWMEFTEDMTLDIIADTNFRITVWVWSKYYPENENGTHELTPLDPSKVDQSRVSVKKVEGEMDIIVHYPTFAFSDQTLYYGEAIPDFNMPVAEKYLHWYSQAEWPELTNPRAFQRDENGVFQLLNRGPEGSTPEIERVPLEEEPDIYFRVDPIDQRVPVYKYEDDDTYTEVKTEITDYYMSKYGRYMGKEPLPMNVRIYYLNEGQDISELEKNPAHNAFFLHVKCNGSCTHISCNPTLATYIEKHHSAGNVKVPGTDQRDVTMWQEYWLPEFYLNPIFCTITIVKEGDVDNGTYVFDIYKKTVPEDPGDTTAQDYAYYTSVSVQGNGSVTVNELPIGEYKVVERTNWSWRYSYDKEWYYNSDPSNKTKNSREFELINQSAFDDITIVFKNKRDTDTWLNGFSSIVVNTFNKLNSSRNP